MKDLLNKEQYCYKTNTFIINEIHHLPIPPPLYLWIYIYESIYNPFYGFSKLSTLPMNK